MSCCHAVRCNDDGCHVVRCHVVDVVYLRSQPIADPVVTNEGLLTGLLECTHTVSFVSLAEKHVTSESVIT